MIRSHVLPYVLGCVLVGVALLLAVLCHPAIFYGGRPLPMPMGAFADLFYVGQWLAFFLTAAALAAFALVWKWHPAMLAPFPRKTWVGPVLAGALLLYLLAAGMPHKANKSLWHQGRLGILEFLRGSFKTGEN